MFLGKNFSLVRLRPFVFRSSDSLMKATTLPLCLTLATMVSASALANDLDVSPLAIRFPTALGHLNFYGDVAAMSGSAGASKWESSPNPSNKSWVFPSEYDWRVSVQYSNVSFDNDTRIDFLSESSTFDAGAAGVFRLAYLNATSNEKIARGLLPLPFEFDLDGYQLSWGKKFNDEFALGAEVGLSQSETIFKGPGFDVANTDKDSWSFRLGGQWKPADKWYLGLYGDYINGSADTALLLPTPLGIVRGSTSDTVEQWLVHPGVAYEFAENSLVHADFEAGWISDGETTLDIQRWSVGTDIPVVKGVFIHAGAAVDSYSNVTWSTGVGFYPSKKVFIDLAYQNNAFPELNQEFGRSQTLNASISIQW